MSNHKVIWNKGKKGCYSEETLNKMSKARKGKTYEEIYGYKKAKELREKLSNSNKGQIPWIKGKHHTKESIEKRNKTRLNNGNGGYKTPEMREKMREFFSKINKGRVRSDETKQKLRQYNLGKHLSEETKIKISKAKKEFSWNRGLTKETDERVRNNKGNKGNHNIAWNRGLTKETDERINKYAKSISISRKKGFDNGKIKIWSKGLTKETDERLRKNSEKQKGEKNHRWLGGKSFEPYTVNWTDTLKKSIRERDHYTCQICLGCGDNVHHIDYDKKNCNPDNLITLCVSCHAKTNIHRKYWKEYFIPKLESTYEKTY